MTRILIFVLVFSLLYLVLKLWWHSVKRKIYANTKGKKGVINGGMMVRDPISNTFLPIGESIKYKRKGEVYYFCSEKNKEKFIREKGWQND